MNRPTYIYEDTPDEARRHPDYGQSVEVTPRVEIRQDVKHNLGRLIGVQTEVVQGNIYGGDIYQVQVYAFGSPSRSVDWGGLLDKETPPYKYLFPYTARDRAIFKGREAEIELVTRQIKEQRLVVVYGKAGVGKTSLLAAGVIPRLMEDGALVVKLQDYTQPLKQTIRDALVASPDQISIPLPEGLTLPDMVHTVYAATKRTLLLILDQFEGLFEPTVDDKRRATTIESLAGALRTVDPESLRLILVIRSDAQDRLGSLHDRLPDLWSIPIAISPLSREQAQTAIEAPLAELGFPSGVSYVGDLVANRLVPDLDALTPNDPDRISPSHLQIVCYWLYQAACTRRPPLIDEELYLELKGPEGIMATYLDTTLKTRLSTQRRLAKHLMEAMAYPDLGPWVPPEQLPFNGSSPDQVRDVLDSLVEAKLLVRRGVNGTREYAFASPIVAQKVRDQAPASVKRSYQAQDDLERTWSAWLAHESLASRIQLGYLERARAHLSPSAVKVLLLLRSAVARDVPDNPWPAQLRGTDRGPELIRQLEEPEAPDLTWRSDPSMLNEAERLLGLTDENLPDRPGHIGGASGPVAWSAVSHPEPVTRQTAALALTALEPYPQEALNRLGWALEARGKSLLRRSALRGALIDADPENMTLRSGLTPMDRVGVWLWRARRWLIHDRNRLVWLMMGGGIGAGLALGLLRALIGALAGQMVGIMFAMYFWWAWILGAALSLGVALARPLLLGRSEGDGGALSIWRAPLHPDRLPSLVAVGLGTLFFGLAHLTVAWFNGLNPAKAPLVAPMGLVAGLGLSLALYGQPRVGLRLRIRSWLLRLTTAALTFVLAQAVSIVTRDKGGGIAIAWTGNFYRAALSGSEMLWWQQIINSYPQWFDYLALLDAALVGIFLTIGITAGLVLAGAWLAWWRRLVNQADE